MQKTTHIDGKRSATEIRFNWAGQWKMDRLLQMALRSDLPTLRKARRARKVLQRVQNFLMSGCCRKAGSKLRSKTCFSLTVIFAVLARFVTRGCVFYQRADLWSGRCECACSVATLTNATKAKRRVSCKWNRPKFVSAKSKFFSHLAISVQTECTYITSQKMEV
jgi:hypothetical protein